MLLSNFFFKPVLWWNVKTSNIEYYDIQYVAGRTINHCNSVQISFRVNLYFGGTYENHSKRELSKNAGQKPTFNSIGGLTSNKIGLKG